MVSRIKKQPPLGPAIGWRFQATTGACTPANCIIHVMIPPEP
ncbi:MAG: hypothetical protein Q6353_018135 [Candidatus Sigynarchaeum springense]